MLKGYVQRLVYAILVELVRRWDSVGDIGWEAWQQLRHFVTISFNFRKHRHPVMTGTSGSVVHVLGRTFKGKQIICD